MLSTAAMVVVSAICNHAVSRRLYFPFVYKLESSGWHNAYVIVSFLVFVVNWRSFVICILVALTLRVFRYDQLMDIGWKWLIPAALINIVFSAFSVFLVQAVDAGMESRRLRI